MSELNLDNIVGFKAVDKDGNEQNVTVDEMVDMVATRMVSALSETSSLSEISTLATAAATGNDVYENELPTVTDAANVRVLQSGGEAAQMTMQSLATKLGGLIGTATVEKNGLMSKYSAANWVREVGTSAYDYRLYRVCKINSNNIIELFGRPNGRLDELYGFFRIFTFDKKVVANLVSGTKTCYHFYIDDTYLYILSSGSNYIRSVARNMTLSLENVFSDVTNSISVSSLTEIMVS